MAGEKLRVLRRGGPIIAIRAKADQDYAEGDFSVVGGIDGAEDIGSGGFWLQDIKTGEEGDFCISANVVEGNAPNVDNNQRRAIHFPVPAGHPLIVSNGTVQIAQSKTANLDRSSPGVIAKVYREHKRNDTKILMVWGHH